jgi:transcriptional regulator with XRE-family HTH domain
MTPDRLRECLGALNWSTAALAAMAQVSPITARRWLNGQREIPSKVSAAMEAMVAAAATLCSGRSQNLEINLPTDG